MSDLNESKYEIVGLPPSYGTKKCSECQADPPEVGWFWERFVEIDGKQYSLPICDGCDETSLTLCTKCCRKAEKGEKFNSPMKEWEHIDKRGWMFTQTGRGEQEFGPETHTLCPSCTEEMMEKYPRGHDFPPHPDVHRLKDEWFEHFGIKFEAKAPE